MTTPTLSAAHRSVCVYCGSRSGHDPGYALSADALGQGIGQRSWRLVYGGGRVGLMGRVADATLTAGGTVLGVIPKALMAREVGHDGLTEQVVVPDMHERKRRMAEAAHAFIALPGGIGTFEELFEVWTWQHLGYHSKPLILLDVGGYYQPLLRFIDHAVQQGFIDSLQRDSLWLCSTPEDALQRIEQHGAAGTAPADYRQI